MGNGKPSTGFSAARLGVGGGGDVCLAVAQQRPSATEQHRLYISSSRKGEQARAEAERLQITRTRRFQKRAWWALVGVGLLLALGFGGTLWQTRLTAQREAIVMTSTAQGAINQDEYQRVARMALYGLPRKGAIPLLSPWSDELEAKLMASQIFGQNFIAQFEQDRGPWPSNTFSSDGKHLLTVLGKSVRLSASTRGTKVAELLHDAPVFGAHFTPDGAGILTHTATATWLWDGVGGKNILIPGTRLFSSAAYSTRPVFGGINGSLFLMVLDNTLLVFETTSGKKIATLPHFKAVARAIFSPDGSRIVTHTEEKLSRFWDTARGTEIASWDEDLRVNPVFSHDGFRFLTRDFNTVYLRDGARGTEIAKLSHELYVRDAQFSPDGTRLVTSLNDQSVRVYDGSTGVVLATLPHEETINLVAFNADGSRFVTLSGQATARLWDTKQAVEIAVLSRGKNR